MHPRSDKKYGIKFSENWKIIMKAGSHAILWHSKNNSKIWQSNKRLLHETIDFLFIIWNNYECQITSKIPRSEKGSQFLKKGRDTGTQKIECPGPKIIPAFFALRCLVHRMRRFWCSLVKFAQTSQKFENRCFTLVITYQFLGFINMAFNFE